jgi:subtilase family serine protease
VKFDYNADGVTINMTKLANLAVTDHGCTSIEPLESRTLLSVTEFWAALRHAPSTHNVQPSQVHRLYHHKMTSGRAKASPNLVVMPNVGTGPAGYAPADIRKAYGFDSLAGDGTGQTIAVVDAYNDRSALADLQTFSTRFGLSTPSLTQVAQNGSTRLSKLSSNSGWGLETSLDIQWVHAIAPGAKILLVEANSAGYNDLLAAVDYAKTHASVVSMSWGSGEFSSETSYDSHFTQSKVTFVASSGDTGGAIEWPASSPYVLAVGGTSLNLNATDGTYASESGWNGSGGGISTVEAKPSYQQSVTQSSTQRTSPDISYNADPNTGFSVFDSNYNGSSGWFQVGGTSAGAPQWAALVSIANQGRATAGKSTLGGSSNVLPALYTWANAQYTSPTAPVYFHDVTGGTAGSFSAGTGYDLVTGAGSPLAAQVIPGLINL